jgi:hypothetical protein
LFQSARVIADARCASLASLYPTYTYSRRRANLASEAPVRSRRLGCETQKINHDNALRSARILDA